MDKICRPGPFRMTRPKCMYVCILVNSIHLFITEISFELRMETISMLMILAVMLCHLGSGFESRSGLNFSGLSFAAAQVA